MENSSPRPVDTSINPTHQPTNQWGINWLIKFTTAKNPTGENGNFGSDHKCAGMWRAEDKGRKNREQMTLGQDRTAVSHAP